MPQAPLPSESHLYCCRDDAGFRAALEQCAYGLPPPRPVIDRPFIDIHAHEGVGPGIPDSPVETLGICESGLAMCEPKFNAAAEIGGNLGHQFRAEVSPDDELFERASLIFEPLPEVALDPDNELTKAKVKS